MKAHFSKSDSLSAAGLAGRVCACALLTILSGCSSINQGAYVGNGCAYDTQGRPEAQASSTVPLFASRDVKDDARNRIAMEKSTGRPVAARPVTVNDVIAWRQAGVSDSNVITHIRTHGLYQPLQGQDILTLQNHGVSVDVIRAMKEHPYPKVDAPTPPPKNTGSAFTRNSRNPDTNPGNGYYSAESREMNSRGSTVAPPVASSGTGKPRLQSAGVSPAYGSSAGVMYDSDGAMIIDGGGCSQCYGVPQEFIMQGPCY